MVKKESYKQAIKRTTNEIERRGKTDELEDKLKYYQKQAEKHAKKIKRWITMPYSKKRYGTKAQYRKMKSCVKKVSTIKGVNPFAVCRASIYKKKRRWNKWRARNLKTILKNIVKPFRKRLKVKKH